MKRDLNVNRCDGSSPALSNKPHFERNIIRANLNMLLISIARRLPFQMKNRIIEWTGVDLGEDVYLCYGIWFDGFHPDLIHIGDRTTIGGSVKILTHEATQNEYRKGEVIIGENVLVGTETLVLPGVEIGDDARIAAGSVVHRDVDSGELVGGVPIETIDEDYRGEDN